MGRFAASLFPGPKTLSERIWSRGGRAGDSSFVRAVVHSPAPLSAQEVAKMESTLAPVPAWPSHLQQIAMRIMVMSLISTLISTPVKQFASVRI
jgi:hypothetical protein